MALSSRVARPLLASIFVVGGWDAFWNPASKAKKAEVVTEPLAETASVQGLDAETLVRVNGAIQVGAGILLAVGKFRRLASLALIGSIVPTTYAGHRFWEESDPTTRSQQKMHFLKNIGLLGGLILAAFDTEGEPSLAWRAKRQARELETALGATRATGRRKARQAQGSVTPVVSQVSKSGVQTIRGGRAASRRARRRLGAAGLDLAEKVALSPEARSHAHDAIVDVVKDSTLAASHAVQHAAELVSDVTHQMTPPSRNSSHWRADGIAPFVLSGAGHTTDALSKLREHLPVDAAGEFLQSSLAQAKGHD
jgi:putative oxidoreductase